MSTTVERSIRYSKLTSESTAVNSTDRYLNLQHFRFDLFNYSNRVSTKRVVVVVVHSKVRLHFECVDFITLKMQNLRYSMNSRQLEA